MLADLAIVVRGLMKSYGPVRALNGVDLTVRRGEIVGFLGPNGAGKTTTIRCLLDLIRPDSGMLRVLGLDPQRQGVALRRQVGYLPGDLRLDENLTVETTLRLWATLHAGRVDWAFVRHLVARLDLDLRPRIRNLSRGQRQKVGLALALLHRPALLLLDEPTAGLDPLLQREVLALLRDRRAEDGTTVFFSSHILSEVEAIADRVVMLRQGVVVEVLAPAALAGRALRRVRVRFAAAVPETAFAGVPGVRVLERTDDHWLIEVSGAIDPFLKALARFPVRDLEVERPSLEEIFLRFYAAPGEQR